MNKLIETQRKFGNGEIDKSKYIDEMYNIHSGLFEYAEFLGKTNISQIEIIDNNVIMKFRDSEIKFICKKNDKRLAPFDTLNFGDYEHEELKMQFKLIGSKNTIMDIGGNFGWYAMHVARNNPDSNILCFEPIPSTYTSLNDNIKLNKLTNIKTFNFGFSEEEGSFDFYFNPTLSVNASLAILSDKQEVESIKCSVKKLDDFTMEYSKKIDFIKCDVEGAELLVFKGGADLLKKDHPIVFTEMLRKWTAKFNYHPNDIITFFHNLGYICFTEDQGQLCPFNFVDENTQKTNYFFLHNISHANQINHFSKK